MIRFEDILEKVEAYKPDFDEEFLQRAYVYSAFAHKGQTRRSGEPYLIHPLNVAYLLAEMRLDEVSIAVGLLHDVLEDTLTTKEELAALFGEEVAELVDGVTKISRYAYVSKEEQQAETFRKMILAMISDLRVILIKLADRLHNMRTLDHLPEERRVKIAQETMEIYAPIANRLGMGVVKSELEDTAFRYLSPGEYHEIEQAVKEKMRVGSDLVDSRKEELQRRLSEAGIDVEVTGRLKTNISIHQKLVRQGISIAQLYDYIALRVTTASVGDCYAALGVVHQRWRPVPGRIKDYIAMPKPNFYQSLHTTVVGQGGTPFEVQIRTREMDLIAEQGVAAHWKYKEGRISSDGADTSFLWLRQLVEWQNDVKDPRTFLNSLKIDLYPDEVYTFSPRGDVFAFPRGATVLDFAYRIHTDVGHQCVGVRVNGRLVPIKTGLQNGDIVEIITGPHQKPSREWLNLVVTARARHKIRHWLNTEQKKHSVELGRKLLDKEARRHKVQLKKVIAGGQLDELAKRQGSGKGEDLLADVGYGKVSARSVLESLAPERMKEPPQDQGVIQQAVRKLFPFGSAAIKVRGADDIMTYLAKCCSPLPGEPIVGYVTRGRGVAVHGVNCPNVENLLFNPDREIKVEWGGEASRTRFAVDLECMLEDRPGALAQALAALGELQVHLLQVDARTGEGRGRIDLSVEIGDIRQLDRLMRSIQSIDGIVSVRRKYNLRPAMAAE